MNFYENYILPYLIHWACSIKPIMYQRKKVIPMAKGTVLEVGIGTGLNLPFYDLNKINKVIGLEPSKKMHTKANETARRSNVSLELIDRYAEDIPLDDDSVDTIVVTYTLCSINETDNALKELHRVLKNDGFLIFCEHGLSPDEKVISWQNKINPYWEIIAGGCNLNKNIPEILNNNKFEIENLETMYLPSIPKFFGYNYFGKARIVNE